MHELAAVKAADHVAPALAQRSDAKRRGGRAADEVDCRGDALQFLRCIRLAGIDGFFCTQTGCRGELRLVDVASDHVLRALCAEHRDTDQAEAAAAQHCDALARADLGQLGGRAVRREPGAGQRGCEAVLDAARINQVLGIGYEQVRRIRAGAAHAEKTDPRYAVIVLAGFANRAFSAADPRIHDLLLSHPDTAGAWAQGLDHTEGLVPERERQRAALGHSRLTRRLAPRSAYTPRVSPPSTRRFCPVM